MFLNSSKMQIMSSGLDALAQQQKTILHNIANIETPNYKAKKVVFSDVLKNSVTNKYEVKTRVETDNTTEMRADGNNVDSDAESLKLYENYIQTQYLYSKISSEINNYRYVLKQGPR